jgi:DNA-binding transcriptional ArsR family regulator
MAIQRSSKLFGSPRRTDLLLLLSLIGESYPSELERLLGVTKPGVAYIVDDLEIEGIVASRRLGRTRRIALNPRYFAARELKALLDKLAEGDDRLQRIAATRRARPRRKGKEL